MNLKNHMKNEENDEMIENKRNSYIENIFVS